MYIHFAKESIVQFLNLRGKTGFKKATLFEEKVRTLRFHIYITFWGFPSWDYFMDLFLINAFSFDSFFILIEQLVNILYH